MQDFWQELYPEEENYSEEKDILFSLDPSNFQTIVDTQNWSKLQQEFESQQNPLSQSFLIWPSGSGPRWMLADFGNQKTYYINSIADSETGKSITNEEGHPRANVSELPDFNEKLKDAQTICKLLRDPQTERAP